MKTDVIFQNEKTLNHVMKDNDYYFIVIHKAKFKKNSFFSSDDFICSGWINDTGEEFNEARFRKKCLKMMQFQVLKIYEIIPFKKDIAAGRNYRDNFDAIKYKKELKQKTK